LAQLLAEAEARLAPSPLAAALRDGETFLAWCERLASEGLRVDGRPFRLDDRPAMRWIYEQVPSTADEAFRYVLVLQKSAQVGFTVMEMLAAIYLGLRFAPGTVGMFMPNQRLAEAKSSSRFLETVRSVPAVHALMRDPTNGRLAEGNRFDRRIGGSRFVYTWTSGRMGTESTPMDVVSLDEVQEMTLESIEKLYERLSASNVRFMMMGSTANWPESDINHWYRRGSQYRFHTRCPTCGVMEPLDEYFPSCIRRTGRDAYYVCREGHRIEDPQDGAWKPDHLELEPTYDPACPRAKRPLRIRSIHFPQMLSPTISPGEILDAYNAATNLKSFYNHKLGKPFVDPDQTPVTLEHLRKCVEEGRAAGVTWAERANGAFMGIDQMGNFNVVWIKKRLPDGRQQVLHVEEIYGPDPFARCGELMRRFGVIACVVEINPNYNEAKRFAQAFEGKVFLCDSFSAIDGDMVQWSDRGQLSTSDRRTTEEARDRFRVHIDQFKCMQWAMSRFVRTECLMPDPQELVQEVIDKGVRQTAPVLPRAFTHFTKTALVTERDEENGTNRYRRVVRKIGVDPHHSYANMLCDVAMSRAHGTASFLFLDDSDPRGGGESGRPAAEQAGGLPEAIKALVEEVRSKPPICATCTAYPGAADGQAVGSSGLCGYRNLTTGAGDPACELFEPVT
jgi:hypothetical protein